MAQQCAGDPTGAGEFVGSKGSRVDPHGAAVVVTGAAVFVVALEECVVDATTAEDGCFRPPDADGLLVHAAASVPASGSAQRVAVKRNSRRRRRLVS